MSAHETMAPMLADGKGSLVTTEDGRILIDLTMGFGAAFLGHAHPAISAAMRERSGRLWSNGRRPSAALARVTGLLRPLLPAGMQVAGLCSTGMEAAEFALRVAAVHTGRGEFAAFARSMHGKSAMTASLSWSSAVIRTGREHTVPFVADAGEPEMLAALEQVLGSRRVAALLVEPIQGSNAAHEASLACYDRVIALCRAYGTLCVFDEILTGLHRTGTPFYVDRLASAPDAILFAKCIGNGFPVTAVALAGSIQVTPAMLPGSTFSGNELALCAVEATLEAMASLGMSARIAAIEQAVRAGLQPLVRNGARLRGRGALWCLELPEGAPLEQWSRSILGAGVLVSLNGRALRLLPAATIELEQLRDACGRIVRACES